jgi:GH15 family glucan-1,4-alpha-glucosidase
MAVDLFNRSVQIILKNQSPSGAYVASPAFPTYAYCWLRDGTYIAHAMDRAGHPQSAAAFFRWVDQTIRRYAEKVARVVAYQATRQPLDTNEFLHTRYNLDGSEVTGVEWSNFQIDGYGTWLWGLAEHVTRTGERRLLAEVAESVRLTVRYLAAVWCLPNSDCWEEHPEYQHPYSLAAVYGGLQAAVRLAEMGVADLPQEEIIATAQAISQFVRQYGVKDGHLMKHIRPVEAGEHDHDEDSEGVDASLLGACTPYGLFLPQDPIWQATLEKIEHDLHRPGGGVVPAQQ